MTNLLLWVLQLLLAAAFFAHGWLLLSPPADLAAQINASMPAALRIFLGVAEVAAAAGLVLPGLARIATWLTPLAAAGLVPIMTGATVLHLWRSEFFSALITAILLALVAFVAWMRWKVAPIPERTLRRVT